MARPRPWCESSATWQGRDRDRSPIGDQVHRLPSPSQGERGRLRWLGRGGKAEAAQATWWRMRIQ
eukprot:355664-Chlamydomonas_euryale.AAC.15